LGGWDTSQTDFGFQIGFIVLTILTSFWRHEWYLNDLKRLWNIVKGPNCSMKFFKTSRS
jgi:hypothetical protein